MFYEFTRKHLHFLPRPAAIALAFLWYGLMLGLALAGIFEPQAEFQYLAM